MASRSGTSHCSGISCETYEAGAWMRPQQGDRYRQGQENGDAERDNGGLVLGFGGLLRFGEPPASTLPRWRGNVVRHA